MNLLFLAAHLDAVVRAVVIGLVAVEDVRDISDNTQSARVILTC